jgi:hypothetical protein
LRPVRWVVVQDGSGRKRVHDLTSIFFKSSRTKFAR